MCAGPQDSYFHIKAIAGEVFTAIPAARSHKSNCIVIQASAILKLAPTPCFLLPYGKVGCSSKCPSQEEAAKFRNIL